MELSNYIHIVLKRSWLILITTIVVTAIVVIGSLGTSPTYEAVVRLRIVPYSLGAPDYGSYIYFDRLANTYSEIVNSEAFSNQAKTELGLDELPDFSIEVIPQTELMRLAVQNTDPAIAQRVANTLASLLIAQNQTNYDSGDGVEGSLRERLDSLASQINSLTVQYAELANQVPRDVGQLTEVQRTLDSLQQNYNLLLTNANQASISDLARANAISIVTRADLPEEPVAPNIPRSAIIAVVIGVAAGMVLVFLIETAKPGVYSDAQVESILGTPTIAHIPSIKRANRNDVFEGDRSAADAFRRLRTVLFNEANQDSRQFILVTSAVPNEGKTTVASNLALAIAQNGRSVLLVDADMLRPSLHVRYRLSNLAGLSTVLKGRTKLHDSVQQVNRSAMTILTAGPSTGASAELLSSDKFYNFLDEAIQSCDVVVIDGPAILGAADALILAQQVNCVLWVNDRRRTDRNTLTYAYDQLSHAGVRPIGVVSNAVGSDKNAYWSRKYSPASFSANGTTVPTPKSPAREAAKL
ncbi:MAG: polysaccharide biosynthesis tyrosine autokinase [Anaerolineae bacterium]